MRDDLANGSQNYTTNDFRRNDFRTNSMTYGWPLGQLGMDRTSFALPDVAYRSSKDVGGHAA